jgi:hypothetical protein
VVQGDCKIPRLSASVRAAWRGQLLDGGWGLARRGDSGHEVCCDANAILYTARPRMRRVPLMFARCNQTAAMRMRRDGGGAVKCVDDAREGAMLA